MVKIVEKQQSLEQQLVRSLELANSFVTKNYLDQLEHYPIEEASLEETDIDVTEVGKFYQISKLVYNKDESFIEKLTTIMNVAYSIEGTVTSIIESNGDSVNYYLGVIAKANRINNEAHRSKRKAIFTAFEGAIKGNLIGSEVQPLAIDQVQQLNDSIGGQARSAIASISGIVSLREDQQKGMEAYVQGIENVVDSLRGQAYTIVFIADPVNNSEIQSIKQGYELIYSQLVTYNKNTITLNEQDSLALSKSTSEGVTKGITKGISLTQSKSTSISKTIGGSVGVNGGVGFPGIAYAGVNVGFNASRTKGTTNTASEGKSFGESEQLMNNKSQTIGSTVSAGVSMQLNYENKSVQGMLDKIDKQLERLNSCENYGAFNCAAYVLTDNPHATLTVSANYNALFRGEDSNVQASFINSWTKKSDVVMLLTYIQSFVHPRFQLRNEEREDNLLFVTPASMMNSKEVALQIGLPKKSIHGLAVIPMAAFGRNIPKIAPQQALHIGNLFHMGNKEESNVQLNIESLTAHTFITGSTGAGKSTTIYHMLRELQKKSITFLVVEPVKGEYKHVFGHEHDINVFGSNPALTPLLKINPFSFPNGIHILEHIDRLVEIFNVCWPMYAAMPAVLKESIEHMYEASGWDLVMSANKRRDSSYPNFVDLKKSLERVIHSSAYSEELKSNYKGSLLTRVNSLTNGLNGIILNPDELSNEVLFDQSTIIDLSRIGSSETKSLIMGILVMKLQEYRMVQGGMNMPLKHVTVLEEAHHLLKRTSSDQSLESSNLLGKSVEMLANAIAEMRTYGEGFIIADQAPGLLDLSVIRNTNTKIVLQTPEFSDRQLVGKASNMSDVQIDELAKLSPGVAAIYQNRWLEPVLCQIQRPDSAHIVPYTIQQPRDLISPMMYKKQLASFLLHTYVSEEIDVDIDWLILHKDILSTSTRNKHVLEQLFEEYRTTGALKLWKKNEFAKLATLVTETLELNRIVDDIGNEMKRAKDIVTALQEAIEGRIQFDIDLLTLRVSQCFLRYQADNDTTWESLYGHWCREVKRTGLI